MDAFFIGGGDGGGRYRGDGVDDDGGGAAAAHAASTSAASGATAAAPGTEDNRVAGGVLHCIDNMAGASSISSTHTRTHRISRRRSGFILTRRLKPSTSPPIADAVLVLKHVYVPQLSP